MKLPTFTLKASSTSITFFLTQLVDLKKYSAVEATISIYPLKSSFTAENIEFAPFEDYVGELVAGRRSTYRLIQSYTDKTFGVFISLFIGMLFWLYLPTSLLSVEAVVALLGAYAIGKEFWHDIDRLLESLTRSWRLRWSDIDYFYIRQDFGTIQRFWQRARQQRYGFPIMLPKTFDFVAHSNSKTIDLAFTKKDLQTIHDHKGRILTVEFSPKSHSNLLAILMIGCKLSLVKNYGVITMTTEYYQGLNQRQAGTPDLNDMWHNHQVLKKKFLIMSRFKLLLSTTLIKGILFELEQ